MTENTIPVAFLPAAIDACAMYRQFLPHINIANTRFLYRPGTLNVGEFADCKVAVVQRQVSVHNLAAMKHIQERGIKIVYDLDDNVWNLPAANPGKKLFDEYRAGFSMCAKEADVITVSTKGLQTAAKTHFDFKKEIVICPNGMDFNFFRQKPITKDDGLTVIGWAGSNTHREDLLDALHILPGVLDNHPNSRIEFVGAPPDRFQHSQMRFRMWTPVGEFANRLASWAWDISIAPLAENVFNRSKCLSTHTSIYGLLDGVPVRRSLYGFLKTPAEKKHLPGPDGRWRRVVAWEKIPEERGYSIQVRGGDFFHVTKHHRFRLNDFRIVEARDLKVGDTIDEVTYKDLPKRRHVLSEDSKRVDFRPVADYDMGWFIGQYIGDGIMSHGHGPRGGTAQVGISIDIRRTDLSTRLGQIADRWGATWKIDENNEGNGGSVQINSQAVKGFIRQYVGGKDSYTKHLRKSVWRQGVGFMRGIIDGWLDADGHRPVSHDNYKGRSHVWSFGITRNWELVKDLQLLCLLVGYRLRYRRGWATEPNTGKKFKCILGSVRKMLKDYNSSNRNGEIIGIKRIEVSTIAVEVDQDHLFVLPSGLVTHNSCLKLLEAAALKIPCLVSDVQPYNEFCSLGGTELKWLLCGTTSQWRTKLTTLINEPERREYLGQRTYEVAKLFYDMQKLKQNWQRVFEQVI